MPSLHESIDEVYRSTGPGGAVAVSASILRAWRHDAYTMHNRTKMLEALVDRDDAKLRAYQGASMFARNDSDSLRDVEFLSEEDVLAIAE